MKINRVQSVLSIHDRFNLELKMSYLLNKSYRTNTYQVDNYLFIPTNLGVDKDTFPRELFYKSLHSYVRFKTPRIPLDKVTLDTVDSPLGKLRTAIENVRTRAAEAQAIQTFEHELKMFGAIVRGSIRDVIVFLKSGSSIAEDKKRLIEEFIENCSNVLVALRALWQDVCQPSIPLESQQDFLHMDEAIRIAIDENAFRIVRMLDTDGIEDRENDKALIEEVLQLIRCNLERREAIHGEPPPAEDSDNEEFIFRKRILKKFISSVLFLEVRRKEEKRRLEHFLFAIAAGVAMAFTMFIAYQFNQRFDAWSMPVIAASLIAYMMKDRMKAVGQNFFRTLLERFYYDHRINIVLPHHHQRIGYCKEYVRYLDESDLPDRIAMLRQRKDIQQLERELIGETILAYRKKIALYTNPIQRLYPKVFGVNDIVRLNVRSWLQNMDNPRSPLFVLKENSFTKTFGQKAYMLHLITRFRAGDSEGFSVFRIFITQKGLKRIEEIPLVVG